jgi:hypothetical protein
LIEVIANSIDVRKKDDLTQIGHLHLHRLVQDGIIDLSRGDLYSFLSRALKNKMLDEVKNERYCDELTDDIPHNTHNYMDISDVMCDTADYAEGRFFSLHKSVARDAAEYVINGCIESVIGKSRGVVTTLELFYPFDSRNLAYVFYVSVSTFARLVINGQKAFIVDALSTSRAGLEHTLIPEVALVLGLEATSILRHSLKGSYVKF